MTIRGHYLHDLAELERQIYELGSEVKTAVSRAMWSLEHHAPAFAMQVIDHDNVIDDLRYAIEQAAFSLIARQQPLARDLRAISAITGLASELERIGDYAEGIAAIVVRSVQLPALEPPAMLSQMAEKAQAMLDDALLALQHRDASAAERLENADSVVDALYQEVHRWSLRLMHDEPQHIERAMYYVWAAHNLERIADRTVNIGERTVFIATGILSAAHPPSPQP